MALTSILLVELYGLTGGPTQIEILIICKDSSPDETVHLQLPEKKQKLEGYQHASYQLMITLLILVVQSPFDNYCSF